jgi:hypothetical protein
MVTIEATKRLGRGFFMRINIIVILLVALSAGCSSTLNVQINRTPGVSAGSFKTYVVLPLPDDFRPKTLSLIEKRAEEVLRQHLDEGLTARGFEKVQSLDDDPDMIATVYVAYEVQKIKSNPYRYSKIPTFDFSYDEHWLDYGVGTVVLVLADRNTKSIVWQARVDGTRYLGAFEEERETAYREIDERAAEVIDAVTSKIAEDVEGDD